MNMMKTHGLMDAGDNREKQVDRDNQKDMQTDGRTDTRLSTYVCRQRDTLARQRQREDARREGNEWWAKHGTVSSYVWAPLSSPAHQRRSSSQASKANRA